MGKGENAGNQHFLFFPQCFQSSHEQFLIFNPHFILLSANAYQSKILSFGKELSYNHISQCRHILRNMAFENVMEKEIAW